ncbi:DUF3800 domain-containing protein [Streptomyces rimosus]|uniref:DUF3800 domain-containing protein n=1 Tax=Streptomyces rimosus TaxID=1927 RepID=UPI00373AE56E
MSLYLCYLDESGTGQTLNPQVRDSVPVMVIGGFTVPASQARGLAWDFIALKKKFEPRLRDVPSLTQVVHHEIKGETLRRSFRQSGRKQRRRAHGFLNDLIGILEQRECTVLARIWVKQDGVAYNGTRMYATAVSTLCGNFEHLLATQSSSGIAVLDSRNPSDNSPNVHCVTTRRFGKEGDPLPHLPESPVFGHSNTHLGLQIADLVVSAVLAPSAAVTYAADLRDNVHCHPGYAEIRNRHCPRIGELQHRYQLPDGKWTGGVVVSDARRRKSAGKLFAAPATADGVARSGATGQVSPDDLAMVASVPDAAAPAP